MTTERPALHGGPKAVPERGPLATKIGKEELEEILDLAHRKGLPVIEDVAQAAGGSFGGRRLGSLGTMGGFSFDYYKIIVSGEGGFITTDDEWLYTRAQSWHDCAACWRPDRFAQERREGELFCGENYRMSELEGAVALAEKAGVTLLLEPLNTRYDHPGYFLTSSDAGADICRKIAAGIQVSEETIAKDLIVKTGPRGPTYLTADHTLQWLHSEEYVAPRLSVRESYGSWAAKGAKDVYRLAQERVDDYAGVEPNGLSSHQRAKLAEILESFDKQSWQGKG